MSSSSEDEDFVRVRGDTRRRRRQDREEDGGSSSSDEERLGRRLPRPAYETVDDDDEGQHVRRHFHRSKEEALYGVFYEDDSDHQDRPRKGHTRRGGAKSKAPPRFVTGRTLDEEKATETNEETVDDANKQFGGKEAENEKDQVTEVADVDPEEKEALEEITKQREEANQRFLALLEAGRKKGSTVRKTDRSPPQSTAGLGFVPSADAPPETVPAAMGQGGLGFAAATAPAPSNNDVASTMGGLGFRRQGLGLGAAPPQKKKDPNLGTWEKHTKGVGLKLLQKMGWTGSGGLGARSKTGIAKPVEVKVRPANLGLGFGRFKEASTLKGNRKIDAQLRGKELPAEETKNQDASTNSSSSALPKSTPSTLPSVDQLLKQQAWRRGQKRKRKPAADIVPFTELLQEKKTLTIIDMRGPTTTDKDQPIPLAQEALHNVSLMLNTYENKLHNQSRMVQSTREKLTSLQSDVTSIQEKIQQGRGRLDKLEGMLQVMDKVEKLAPAEDALDQTRALVEELSKSFTHDERESLQFDQVLVPTLLGHVLQSSLDRWDPLKEPTSDLVETILQTALSYALRESLLTQHILPRVVRVLQGKWNVQDVESAVTLVEHLLHVTRQFEQTPASTDVGAEEAVFAQAVQSHGLADLIKEEVVHKIVYDKLSTSIRHWKPNLDDRLDIWILPWAVHLDTLVAGLVSEARRKLTTALSSTTRSPGAFCRQAFTVLRPWVGVFKPAKLNDLVATLVVPRLSTYLASLDLFRDVDAWSEGVQLALEMHQSGLVADREWLGSLEGAILAPWARSAHTHLSESAESTAAVVDTYVQCRKQLLTGESSSHKVIRKDTMICRYFYGVLCMIEASAREDAKTALVDLTPPKTTYRAVLARRLAEDKQRAADDMTRILDRDETAETRVRLNRESNNVVSTFREVVEAYARERDISFVPKEGANAAKDGKPIFILGSHGGGTKVQVYLDSNVVYWWNKQATEWQPISLSQLVEHAR